MTLGTGLLVLGRAAVRRPLVTVAAAAVIAAVANHRWTVRNRPPGSLDIDECGYVATALRLGRSIPSVPARELMRLSAESTTAPLVPTLAAPLALVGRGSLASATAIQPVLHGISAVGVAGVTGRLAGPEAAVVAGVAVLGLPGAINASRHQGFTGGAAAGLSLATWALLSTGGCRPRTRAMVLGASVGAMTLSRTMTVGFVPGLAAAAALRRPSDRPTAPEVATAAAAAVTVAGPWWIAQRRAAAGYLFRYGYGDLADQYGARGLGHRVSERARAVLVDVRPALLVPAAIGVLAGAAAGTCSGSRSGPRPSADRDLLAVGGLVMAGAAALLSTSNAGSGFELPLEMPAIAAACAFGARTSPVIRNTLGAWVIGTAVANATLVGRLNVGRERVVVLGAGHVHRSDLLFGGLEYTLRERILTDPRLDPSSGQRSTAEGQWWDAAERVAQVLAEHDGGTNRVVHTITGSGPTFSANTVMLANELRRGALGATVVVDTTTSADDQRRHLTPAVGTRPRVLIAIIGRGRAYPTDRGAEEFLDLATAEGWMPWQEVTLPDGGSVTVLTHMDSPEP